jgi:transposase
MNPIKYDIIAIDVSKETLETLSSTKSFSISNSVTGFKKLFEHLKGFSIPLVVFEATGGYERSLSEALIKNKIPFAKLNPARVRNFAKSEGIKAKTDPIDTRMIMRFALEKGIQATEPLSPKRQKLADLLERRTQLTEAAASEKNRLQNSSKVIHLSIKKILNILEKEISAIEVKIRKIIDEDSLLKEHFDIFLSVVGVGEVTAWSLLANLSEIGSLKRNELVALVGIAPFNVDSGKKKGKRRIVEGRAKVRKCLYMAARTAAMHNPVIKEYVEGLRMRGKPYKCAIVAAMRKLLIHLQSLIKKHKLNLA